MALYPQVPGHLQKIRASENTPVIKAKDSVLTSAHSPYKEVQLPQFKCTGCLRTMAAPTCAFCGRSIKSVPITDIKAGGIDFSPTSHMEDNPTNRTFGQ